MKKRGTPALTSAIDINFYPKSKRSQITIFIIIGVVLISTIALFLLFRSGVIPGIGGKTEKNPNTFLESCMEDKIKEAVEIISSQGGYIKNPLNKTFKFEDEDFPSDISYLCYTQNYYIPCINQEPMLISHLQDEIKNYISEDIEYCLDELEKSLSNQGYVVDTKSHSEFEVNLMNKKIVVNINKKITLTKSGETTTQKDFKIIILNRFYDLAIVVQEILNKETTKCGFNHDDMFHYSEFDIDKFRTFDSSVIYTVKHRENNEKFKFAVRGCVMLPGFGVKF